MTELASLPTCSGTVLHQAAHRRLVRLRAAAAARAPPLVAVDRLRRAALEGGAADARTNRGKLAR